MSKTKGRFASHAEAKRAGWFSRRHETSAAHHEAQAKRDQKRAAREVREEESRKVPDLAYLKEPSK